MKEQSKLWNYSNKHALKKEKTVPSCGKIMVTVFWDSKGIQSTAKLFEHLR